MGSASAFRASGYPVDVCGPISKHSALAEIQFSENLKAIRAESRIRSEAYKLGIEISEMPLYRAYRAMGLFPSEAVNSIIAGRRKK